MNNQKRKNSTTATSIKENTRKLINQPTEQKTTK
jgi:hypothetical protein